MAIADYGAPDPYEELMRHFGGDEGQHHVGYYPAPEDGDPERCPHCFTALDEDRKCWRCDDTARYWSDPRRDDPTLASPRNAQEALLSVQYAEFRALFEDLGIGGVGHEPGQR